MDNFWISCQVMADMKKVYDNLIIINLYILYYNASWLSGGSMIPSFMLSNTYERLKNVVAAFF